MPRREVEDWFWKLGGEFHRLNQEISRSSPKVASGRAWEPRIDLLEEDRRFIVKIELAGVRVENIHLAYVNENHTLQVRGIRDEADYSDGTRTGIHMLEIFYGPFLRDIELPDVPIDPSGIRAQFVNGLLIVLVPKMDQMIVTHTITIRER